MAPPDPDSDPRWMARALELARARLGRTSPNPSVGCVIVRDGAIIAESATGEGGRPHAEEDALLQAGDRACGATIHVTLEPCTARSSGVPSCAERLLAAGPARVLIACADPNPAAAHGAQFLAAAGVPVTMGLMEEQAQALNAGFFKWLRERRPLVTLTADSAGQDARLELQTGEDCLAALDRLGAAGLTRVHALPGTPLAAELLARGLVD